jgi:hypothetical protein
MILNLFFLLIYVVNLFTLDDIFNRQRRIKLNLHVSNIAVNVQKTTSADLLARGRTYHTLTMIPNKLPAGDSKSQLEWAEYSIDLHGSADESR